MNTANVNVDDYLQAFKAICIDKYVEQFANAQITLNNANYNVRKIDQSQHNICCLYCCLRLFAFLPIRKFNFSNLHNVKYDKDDTDLIVEAINLLCCYLPHLTDQCHLNFRMQLIKECINCCNYLISILKCNELQQLSLSIGGVSAPYLLNNYSSQCFSDEPWLDTYNRFVEDFPLFLHSCFHKAKELSLCYLCGTMLSLVCIPQLLLTKGADKIQDNDSTYDNSSMAEQYKNHIKSLQERLILLSIAFVQNKHTCNLIIPVYHTTLFIESILTSQKLLSDHFLFIRFLLQSARIEYLFDELPNNNEIASMAESFDLAKIFSFMAQHGINNNKKYYYKCYGIAFYALLCYKLFTSLYEEEKFFNALNINSALQDDNHENELADLFIKQFTKAGIRIFSVANDLELTHFIPTDIIQFLADIYLKNNIYRFYVREIDEIILNIQSLVIHRFTELIPTFAVCTNIYDFAFIATFIGDNACLNMILLNIIDLLLVFKENVTTFIKKNGSKFQKNDIIDTIFHNNDVLESLMPKNFTNYLFIKSINISHDIHSAAVYFDNTDNVFMLNQDVFVCLIEFSHEKEQSSPVDDTEVSMNPEQCYCRSIRLARIMEINEATVNINFISDYTSYSSTYHIMIFLNKASQKHLQERISIRTVNNLLLNHAQHGHSNTKQLDEFCNCWSSLFCKRAKQSDCSIKLRFTVYEQFPHDQSVASLLSTIFKTNYFENFSNDEGECILLVPNSISQSTIQSICDKNELPVDLFSLHDSKIHHISNAKLVNSSTTINTLFNDLVPLLDAVCSLDVELNSLFSVLLALKTRINNNSLDESAISTAHNVLRTFIDQNNLIMNGSLNNSETKLITSNKDVTVNDQAVETLTFIDMLYPIALQLQHKLSSNVKEGSMLSLKHERNVTSQSVYKNKCSCLIVSNSALVTSIDLLSKLIKCRHIIVIGYENYTYLQCYGLLVLSSYLQCQISVLFNKTKYELLPSNIRFNLPGLKHFTNVELQSFKHQVPNLGSEITIPVEILRLWNKSVQLTKPQHQSDKYLIYALSKFNVAIPKSASKNLFCYSLVSASIAIGFYCLLFYKASDIVIVFENEEYCTCFCNLVKLTLAFHGERLPNGLLEIQRNLIYEYIPERKVVILVQSYDSLISDVKRFAVNALSNFIYISSPLMRSPEQFFSFGMCDQDNVADNNLTLNNLTLVTSSGQSVCIKSTLEILEIIKGYQCVKQD